MSGPGQTPDWQGCLPIYYVQITAIKVNILKNKPFFSLRLPGLFSLCVCAGKAYEPCKLSDLAVTQTINHHHNGNYLEIAVTVENRCICTQDDVKLACKRGSTPRCVSTRQELSSLTATGNASSTVGTRSVTATLLTSTTVRPHRSASRLCRPPSPARLLPVEMVVTKAFV
ncbi:hypothetical protein HU200_038392 [Digitaria exilis]|uniref:Uncharacterized protein n=1 Tax=Digitaria exilis TaxID=1010633 RepID=A0A835BCH0_9POAL|nr:hypothetical protein HU200_038392 [Digitaria exilis]